MSSDKQKIIIADRYTTISTLKPIKDCKSCDFHNNYTCFDHEDEQIKYLQAFLFVNLLNLFYFQSFSSSFLIFFWCCTMHHQPQAIAHSISIISLSLPIILKPLLNFLRLQPHL